MSSDSINYDTVEGPFASQEFVDAIIGPFIVGWVVFLMLWAVSCPPFFRYIRSSQYLSDSRRTKILLWAVFLLTTTNAGLSFNRTMHYSIDQQRDSTTLYAQTAVDAMALLPPSIQAALVQWYLSDRAAKLFQNRAQRVAYLIVCYLAIGGVLIGGAFYTALSYALRRDGTQNFGAMTFNVATALFLGCSAFVDILISLGLCFELRKRVVGFNPRTDSIMHRLMRLAVMTAAPTTLFAVIAVILAFAFPSDSLLSNTSGAFYSPLPAIYFFSLLTTLTARAKIRGLYQTPNPDPSMRRSGNMAVFSGNHIFRPTPPTFAIASPAVTRQMASEPGFVAQSTLAEGLEVSLVGLGTSCEDVDDLSMAGKRPDLDV